MYVAAFYNDNGVIKTHCWKCALKAKQNASVKNSNTETEYSKCGDKMPKQVEPLSVLRPATEIITSARVRILRAKKHIAKLNNLDLDNKLHKATLMVEELENIVKAELKKEQAKKGMRNA